MSRELNRNRSGYTISIPVNRERALPFLYTKKTDEMRNREESMKSTRSKGAELLFEFMIDYYDIFPYVSL